MVNPGQIAVVEANAGRVLKVEVVDGDVFNVVKDVVVKYAREKWEPLFSDFMVVKDYYESRLRSPVTREVESVIKRYGIQVKREGPDTLVAALPVYYVVYESIRMDEDDYHDRGIACVALVLGEEDLRSLKELLSESTRRPESGGLGIEGLEGLEEELEEESRSERRQRKRARGS